MEQKLGLLKMGVVVSLFIPLMVYGKNASIQINTASSSVKGPGTAYVGDVLNPVLTINSTLEYGTCSSCSECDSSYSTVTVSAVLTVTDPSGTQSEVNCESQTYDPSDYYDLHGSSEDLTFVYNCDSFLLTDESGNYTLNYKISAKHHQSWRGEGTDEATLEHTISVQEWTSGSKVTIDQTYAPITEFPTSIGAAYFTLVSEYTSETPLTANIGMGNESALYFNTPEESSYYTLTIDETTYQTPFYKLGYMDPFIMMTDTDGDGFDEIYMIPGYANSLFPGPIETPALSDEMGSIIFKIVMDQ